MFELDKAQATLIHVNLRVEKHGNDKVPGIDLKIVAKAPNVLLNVFSPGLLDATYQRSPQSDLDAGFLSQRRFPMIPGFNIDAAYEGGWVTLETLIGKRKIELAEAKINMFHVKLDDGGTVTCTFKVQISKPDEKQMGKLGSMNGLDVTVSCAVPQAAEPEETGDDPDAEN